MSYLPDSNIIIAGLNGDSAVLARLDKLSPDEVILSAPVLAELEFGAQLSARQDENLKRLKILILNTRFEPFDFQAARLFGELKASLKRRGINKTDFDLAIAAMAIEQSAILVSEDHAFHDGSIPGLQVENWL